MLNVAIPLLTASLLAAAPQPQLDHGMLLTYQGDFVAAKGNEAASLKTFDLTILITEADVDGATLLWTVEETGRGAWPWPDRFGRMDVDERWLGGGKGPSLLYQREQGQSVVSLLLPLIAPEKPLADGAVWTDGKYQHRVLGARQKEGRDVWKVETNNAYGLKRTLWIDQKSPLVVAMQEKVFIGQGEEHYLNLKLVKSESLSAEKTGKAVTAFENWIALRNRLAHEPRTPRVPWNKEQLQTLKDLLPELAGNTPTPALARIYRSAQEDLKHQKDLTGAVSALKTKSEGSKIGEFRLQGTSREVLTREDLQGAITVLHFWEYRDSPLKEPYGQVGYLDFLYRRLKNSGVKVYGVAVDDRLADESQRRRVLASAKRMKAFMNLSYPVLLDEMALLEKLGDPRSAGAKLPLFVVVGPNGEVLHYHVGFYEVHRDRGLIALEKLVKQAADKLK